MKRIATSPLSDSKSSKTAREPNGPSMGSLRGVFPTPWDREPELGRARLPQHGRAATKVEIRLPIDHYRRTPHPALSPSDGERVASGRVRGDPENSRSSRRFLQMLSRRAAWLRLMRDAL